MTQQSVSGNKQSVKSKQCKSWQAESQLNQHGNQTFPSTQRRKLTYCGHTHTVRSEGSTLDRNIIVGITPGTGRTEDPEDNVLLTYNILHKKLPLLFLQHL